MGLGKKASALFDGLRRHRNDGRSSRRPNEPEVKLIGGKAEDNLGVPASEPRRLRLRSRRAAIAPSKQAEAMAQTIDPAQQKHFELSHGAYQYSAVQERRSIQLVEEEEEDLEEETYGGYEEEEEEEDIDNSVAEEMKKLEENFKGISQKYRLINRIGEGNIALLVMG